jgi:hypothetical protein
LLDQLRIARGQNSDWKRAAKEYLRWCREAEAVQKNLMSKLFRLYTLPELLVWDYNYLHHQKYEITAKIKNDTQDQLVSKIWDIQNKEDLFFEVDKAKVHVVYKDVDRDGKTISVVTSPPMETFPSISFIRVIFDDRNHMKKFLKKFKFKVHIKEFKPLGFYSERDKYFIKLISDDYPK